MDLQADQINIPISEWTSHKKLQKWIQEQIAITQPNKVYLCDGSLEEYNAIAEQMRRDGKWIKLNESLRPNSFLARSHPDDVARVEEQTFICSKNEEDAGPTNNWSDPKKMKAKLKELFTGSMQGRTMYVIPYCMGPFHSDKSYIGVEITDSPYVVVNMHLMTRVGNKALEMLGEDGLFIPCMHSVGVPLHKGEKDQPWPCQPTKRHIVHFPEEKSIYSFGSGYGGNALLGKKCFALRIASVLAKEEGWLAEHMLIVGITNPKGKKKYFAAAFPSACGKTNLAMLTPSLPGWKIECVGDDIAWMKIGEDGRLWAINPEYGMFGVAPGTSTKTNANAMKMLDKDSIFTNVALTDDNDVWWEGMTEKTPEHLTDWKGNSWTPDSDHKAAHPNSRFTVSVTRCPILDPDYDDPKGVPIDGFIFGGRRSTTIPLVYQSLSWEHGVFTGASLSSEMTAAAKGTVGKLRHDPFAMLPFCGYNMGDYFAHWLSMEKKTSTDKLPKIFQVNWFLKDDAGKFIWPGFGENIRVLEWMFDRCDETIDAEKSPIGYLPHSLNYEGIDVDPDKLFSVDISLWKKEIEGLKEYFQMFGTHFPKALQKELEELEKRVHESSPTKSR